MRRWRRLALFASLAVAGLTGPAVRANTSTAYLGTGGLVLARTDKIEMRSEELYVSAAEIRVRYVFRNTSGEAVTTLVAFPMPDIVFQVQQTVEIPSPESENFLDFQTAVDGVPVKANVERHVFSAGIDRTPLLQGLGIPLMPFDERTSAALAALPPATFASLAEVGLVRTEGMMNGRPYVMPGDWTLKTTYFWTQSFPAGRDVVIEHRYRPSVGMNNMPQMTDHPRDRWQVAASETARRKYCADPAFLAAASRKPGEYDELWITYVLGTGANWAGPIGEFTLTIDTGSPENRLAVCERDLQRTGPTTFRARRKDYRPDGNLEILILKRMR